MDTITISNLELWTHIGVTDEERSQEQRVLVSINMQLDTKEAGQNDDIHATIDYEVVTNDVRALVTTERVTIERLAEDIASMILEKHKPDQVEITVQKFVIPDTDHVAITINRP